MQTPSTLSIWLAEQLGPLLLVAALVGLVFLAVYISLRARSARMLASRSGFTEDAFVHSLVIYGFDAGIARSAFRYLRTTQSVPFPVQASDRLEEDLGFTLHDVDRSVRDLTGITARIYQPGRRHAPLRTVEDLVRFIQSSPRRSQLAA